MSRPHLYRIAAVAIIATVATGCSSVRRTTPERTATEQILLSRAVDRALERLEISLPPGTTVYMDPSRFEAYDRGYAISALRDRLLVSGVHMVDVRDDAEVVVEIRSGALRSEERRGGKEGVNTCKSGGDPVH